MAAAVVKKTNNNNKKAAATTTTGQGAEVDEDTDANNRNKRQKLG